MRRRRRPSRPARPEGEAAARRAAERLKEAQQMLQAMRGSQSTNQVDDMARQAEDLAAASRSLKARCAAP